MLIPKVPRCTFGSKVDGDGHVINHLLEFNRKVGIPDIVSGGFVEFTNSPALAA